MKEPTVKATLSAESSAPPEDSQTAEGRTALRGGSTQDTQKHKAAVTITSQPLTSESALPDKLGRLLCLNQSVCATATFLFSDLKHLQMNFCLLITLQ